MERPAPAVHDECDFHSDSSASRLISETAHDLRAPLATIREAVRLVRDGDLGFVSTSQRECLSAAIDQCNCASQLVDEMVHTRQFESGFPNARRGWILIDDLRRSVEATLQPWVMPRGIHLLWDGPFEQGVGVYADPTLIRRLIVNLANNAIRVTRDGRPVLIRARSDDQRGMMTWSIVDQGNGIEASDMELIAAGKSPARSTGGLGLMISRQLAAAHFSTLRIESRVGTGTAVSFQTPIGGPASVSAAWTKWRSGLIAPERQTIEQQHQQVHNVLPARVVPSTASRQSDVIHPPRRVRIDVPSLAVELAVSEHQPAFPDQLLLTTVSIGAATQAANTNAFDELLQRSIRITEFAYRAGRRNWVIAWDADRETALRKRAELELTLRNELQGIRLTWGKFSLVPIATSSDSLPGGSLVSRLCDLMVRQSFSASRRQMPDGNRMRLGAPMISPSPGAESRLETEVQRICRRRL
ncbi:HAMP domain-containing histidine kinase [Stieleria sp. TO1_6]|uniref:sensor histidine kinase n=1 Tax=Stieleria tagensis TaxID=2956795 RepID=UPI00209B4EE0|nr:HAMP domain-containing sensor histidine kinase [Stieleria tagensis]MCO8121452.1 HAMP domain-containing histidine kinase [Stieleria tagensis]